jgi:prenylcysteine oxidase / farnesylcysteine lyase
LDIQVFYFIKLKGNFGNEKIYKIFSRIEFNETMMKKYFHSYNISSVILKLQYAYPDLSPTNKSEWHPIELDDNFYYINSMESIISTIETELISSKNIALKIFNKYFF